MPHYIITWSLDLMFSREWERCDSSCRVSCVCSFQSTPLSDVVSRLSVILNVPPPRLLLLREELELQTDATISELGLGIADIIGVCVCMCVFEPQLL